MRRTVSAVSTLAAVFAVLLISTTSSAREQTGPVKLLIITGDNVGAHNWKATTPVLQEFLSAGGKIQVDVTATPGKDLTDENLAKYDVLLLNYKETPQGAPETQWSDANKKAFLKAVREGGKGVVAYHFASAAFANPNWKEFEQAVAGGWRSQGYHGPAHEFKVKKTTVDHPISKGLPAEFDHVTDELYSASMRTRGSVVLATAFCDASKPQGSGTDEAVVWVNTFGKGRVFECVLGHDAKALADKPVQAWIKRGAEWAATGKVGE